MSDFDDTSNWKIKDGTTLYQYKYKGKVCKASEKKPEKLSLQLERLSVLNRTEWRIEGDQEPEKKAGFSTNERIEGLGILDGCHLHAITLDKNENETFKKLHVYISPIALKVLRRTAKVDAFSFFDRKKRPKGGWMRDEIGSLTYYSSTDDTSLYHDNTSWMFADVYLAQEEFDELVLAIKSGSICTARLVIMADVYGFDYEWLGACMHDHECNYAILCEHKGDRAEGGTQARLQEVVLEWATQLDTKTAAKTHGKPNEDDIDPNELESVESDLKKETMERDLEKAAIQLSHDLQGILARVDTFYRTAMVIIFILIVTQVADWIGS